MKNIKISLSIKLSHKAKENDEEKHKMHSVINSLAGTHYHSKEMEKIQTSLF